jgi:hypothetical protein
MKSAVRKTMVVATAFTGAAACAAAFMPSAALATTQQAARPDLKFNVGCVDGTSDWLHFAVIQPGPQSYCFGWSRNDNSSTNFTQQAYCGGNNFGYFAGSNEQAGQPEVVHFRDGSTWAAASEFHVVEVHISRYSGNDGCKRFY